MGFFFFFALNIFFIYFGALVLFHILHRMPFFIPSTFKHSASFLQRCEWIGQKMGKEGKGN
jgi:hypothetical protein